MACVSIQITGRGLYVWTPDVNWLTIQPILAHTQTETMQLHGLNTIKEGKDRIETRQDNLMSSIHHTYLIHVWAPAEGPNRSPMSRNGTNNTGIHIKNGTMRQVKLTSFLRFPETVCLTNDKLCISLGYMQACTAPSSVVSAFPSWTSLSSVLHLLCITIEYHLLHLLTPIDLKEK